MSDWNSKFISCGTAWNIFLNIWQKNSPKNASYQHLLSILKALEAKALNLERFAILVISACLGRNWFDRIQTKCLQQGRKLCHKQEQPSLMGTTLEGLITGLWCNTLLRPHPHLSLKPAQQHMTSVFSRTDDLSVRNPGTAVITPKWKNPTGSPCWSNLIKETHKHGVSFVSTGNSWARKTEVKLSGGNNLGF